MTPPRRAPNAPAEPVPAPRRRVPKTLAYVAPAVAAIGLTAERAFASGGPKIVPPGKGKPPGEKK